MFISVSVDQAGLVSVSAPSEDVDKVKAARRTWRRVAKRVLRSKRMETRKKWLERLKFVTAYMVRRLQSVGKKKTASPKLRAQIEYGKKSVALYKRIQDALAKPYAEGMEKLADIQIPPPGTDIKLKKSDHAVVKTPPKPKPKAPVEKPMSAKELKDKEAANLAAKEASTRKGLLSQRMGVLKASVKQKFQKGVKIMTLFENARDEYAKTKSAAAKQKMTLIARRLGEIKTEIAHAKQRRDKFSKRFKAEMA